MATSTSDADDRTDTGPPDDPPVEAADPLDVGDEVATNEPTSRRRLPPLRTILPWVLVLVLGVTLGVVGQDWNRLRTAESQRIEVADVARDVVTSLTTWDASDGLDDTIADLRAIGTGAFADEIDPFFAGPEGDALIETGASSAAVVRDLFVQTIDGDDATVFVTLDQSINTTIPPAQNILPRRAIIDLRRVDGTWLANDVTVTDGILGPQEQ